MMPRSYLVRFGLARSVALFGVDPDSADPAPELERLARGDQVVVRTHRGTELGEVLGTVPPGFDPTATAIPREGNLPPTTPAPLLRRATPDDRARATEADARRGSDYEAAAALLEAGAWPVDLIDAEPLLDDARTVLHYLGPHRLDAADLVAAFRARLGLDVVLEPAGLDPDGDAADEPIEVETLDADDAHGCGSCGSKGGGCGSCSSAAGCAVRALAGKRPGRPAVHIP